LISNTIKTFMNVQQKFRSIFLLQLSDSCRMGKQLAQPPGDKDQPDVGDEQKNERKEPLENDSKDVPVHQRVGLVVVQLGVPPVNSPDKNHKL